jgi:hypothetical protein
MNIKYKVFFLFLLFAHTIFFLSAETKREELWKWKGMEISWSYDTEDPSLRTLEFKATRKNIESKVFDVAFEVILEKGEYRIDKKNFFYLISHSTGESGGSLFLRIFYPHKKKLEYVFLEVSGYGVIKFVDLNNDHNDEIYVYNQDFYGLSFKTKKEKACIALPPLYQSGFSEFVFPKYYQLVASKQRGKFELKDVTFTPEAEKSVSIYIQKLEQFLETKKDSIIQNEYLIPPLFQYYDYQRRYGREKETLLFLRSLRIRYESSCGENEVKKQTYLGLLLREYFKRGKN